MIMAYLEEENFHVYQRAEYEVDDFNNRIGERVVQDLFFISPNQVEMGRRFRSDWMYQTDATFSTN